MTLKILRGWVVIAFVVLAVLTGCTRNPATKTAHDPRATENEIRIGEFGTMTGSESTFGLSTHKGILMAVEEVNSRGGIKGKKIRLISYDDFGRSEEAASVVSKLITRDKVSVILGEVASSRSLAAAPIAQQYRIPMITPSSTNPRVTQVGDYIFRVCFIDPFQGAVMARFARTHLKLKRGAIFRDVKSDYSVGLANYFHREFERLGGKIVADVSYASGDMDFRAQIMELKQKKIDLLFVPGYYTEVGLIAKQARGLKFRGVLLGGDGWDSEKLTEIGGDAIVGGYFSSHYSPKDKNPNIQNFVTKFRAQFGEIPDSLAAMGYDAARVAIQAIKKAKDLSPTEIRAQLAKTQKFQGVTGLIRINKERNAIKPAVVLRVAGRNNYDFVTSVNP